MQALQAQSQTSAELARDFHCSDRHVRRTIADLIISKEIVATRDGRNILYSLAAVAEEKKEAAAAASSSITAIADISKNSGHGIADMSAINSGHFENHDETIEKNSGHIEDNGGHNSGHAKPKSSKQRHRNRKATLISHGPAANPPRFGPGTDNLTACGDSGTNICPQFFAGFERDMIQFVLVDKIFRDLLMTRAGPEGWEVRKVHGLTWIYPMTRLSLQVGKDTVVFYSADPGDMSCITQWVRKHFTIEYADMESLISRIKYPQNLSSEELTVVVKHPDTIAAIRTSIAKASTSGQFNLQHPSDSIPGLKIYESKGTMRIEFIVHNHKTGASAIDMRDELMQNMPRIHHTPGLFWEFIQKYYSALHHPLIIDTGGHDFLQALSQMSGQFTDALRTIADKIPAAPPTPEDLKLRELRDAINALESSELGDIIRTFRDMLNVAESPTKVFLAGWTVWAKRNFKGRVTKADITSLLLRAHDPIPPADIAEALARLKEVGLLQEDDRLEVCFSPSGAEIARILMAKKEGI